MNTGGNFCPRCAKRVYFAEEVIAMGKHWHKACFVCAECRKRLDSHNCADRDGEAYCTHCYRRMFGPKGYGFGVGAGTLSMDSATSNVSAFSQAQVAPLIENNSNGNSNGNGHASPTSPVSPKVLSPRGLFPSSGSDVCRRCGKAVYLAERMMGGGAAWHNITCFTCAECNKRLESTTLCEKNNDIYCKTCYARNFGPKGYGYGVGAGTLQMQQ